MFRLPTFAGWVLMCCIMGCVSTPSTEKKDQGQQASIHEIDQWIDQLMPQLVRKVTKNPNLKGKAFTLAAWDVEKNTLKTQISALEKDLMQQLTTKLLEHPGVNCVPRSPVKPLDLTHQDRLMEISCEAYRDIEWYLLLTARIRPTTGKLAVRIHGAFPDQNHFKPIAGLSESFTCSPTPRLTQLLDKTHVDEYLRGLRYLPFRNDQKDLIAAYLARRASCIFRSMAQGDSFTVYVDKTDFQSSSFFRDMLSIIALYLDQFQEIRMVSRPPGANALMICKTYRITEDLCQVWITVESKKGGKKIGASTATYIKKKIP